MRNDELKILEEISSKLDKLIILLKLSNRDLLDEFKNKIKKDEISSKILELSDGTLTYSGLVKIVSQEMNVAEITVKKKISALRDMGFLIGKRKGKEVYYENTGLTE